MLEEIRNPAKKHIYSTYMGKIILKVVNLQMVQENIMSFYGTLKYL